MSDRTTHTVEVRHPYVGEVPAELMGGFEAFRIDPEWQWVLVSDGKIKAQMLCADTHGVLTIMRLSALPDAPHGWGVKLFRGVFAECKKLGLLGYITFLADDQRAERRLMSIVARSGGYLKPTSGVWAAGRFYIGY